MILGRNLLTWNPPPPHLKLSRLTAATSRVALSAEPETERVKLAESLQSETLKILEWPSVCTQLSAFSSTSMGLAAARSARIPLGRSPGETRRFLDQTTAAVAVSRQLDFSGIEDVSPIVDAAVSGEMLSIRELCSVSKTLRSARSLVEQLEEISSEGHSYERYSPLLEILQKCDFLTKLEQKIEFCVDCKYSLVLTRASEELELIRSAKKTNMENLESMLKNISSEIFRAGGIDRPLVTKRRSRMCVAIRTTHRYLLPSGIILGSSGSGATYYMEPREAVDLNNNEVRLSNAEKMEELTILSLLSAEIAEFSEQIKYLLDRIVEVDLAFARAGHARWMNGVCPYFSSENENCEYNSFLVHINGMQHPLLLESSLKKTALLSTSRSACHSDQEPGSTNSEIVPVALGFPVPVDFRIGNGVKVIVISGPNTGGKTASMKTLGLASIMFKAGMYLPAQSNPKLPWFDLVLADIGDQQSLEQSLSTFSGHISRINKILKVASERSLVLLDEIGSGTDPAEGVALSASILQYIKERVNLAVVTTHYADLTRLKEKDARFENAAMEFSMESLQPTYRILWGSMGGSNALSIAKTIGFDENIIERAKSWVKKLAPEKMQKLNSSLYQSLVKERNKLVAQAERATSLHSDVLKLYNEFFNVPHVKRYLKICDEADDLDARKAALKAKETQQVQQQLKAVKAEIDTIVQEFEKQLRNTNPDDYGKLLKESESVIASVVKARQLSENLPVNRRISSYIPRVGEQVLVKGLGNKVATVVEAPSDDKMVLVQYGKIRARVNASGISPLDGDNRVSSSASHSKRQGQQRVKGFKNLSETINDNEVSYGAVVQTSKNTVDLRGMRVEEAAVKLDMAISSRGSKSVVFIIHGIGTGVLREYVLERLRKHPRIANFEQESLTNYGCTIAYIK
ncbi:MutS2 family protein [Striga asiatica]|uniref:MutS2 family protein n=1 Tax=Striga asiatica TaxID=4170 RepID=A0A5A7NY22_STRAF|nr:MutS2 family protein [Striga asiatica]